MATLATPQNVRDEGNLPATIGDGKLTPHIKSASIELKRLLTPDVYEAIVAETPATDRRTECIKAEAVLALSYAVFALNIETSGTGIVTSKGWDQTRSDMMGQAELERLSEHFRDLATSIIGPYLPTTQTSDASAEEAEEAKQANLDLPGLTMRAV